MVCAPDPDQSKVTAVGLIKVKWIWSAAMAWLENPNSNMTNEIATKHLYTFIMFLSLSSP